MELKENDLERFGNLRELIEEEMRNVDRRSTDSFITNFEQRMDRFMRLEHLFRSSFKDI